MDTYKHLTVQSIKDIDDRELRFLVMKATGYSVKETAEAMNITVDDVRKIIKGLNKKCGTKSLVQTMKIILYYNIV